VRQRISQGFIAILAAPVSLTIIGYSYLPNGCSFYLAEFERKRSDNVILFRLSLAIKELPGLTDVIGK